MSAVRFGFLGAGWIAGRALAPAVHAADGAVLQAVAARDAERAGALEPVGRVHPDYAALLDDPDVDVVYISLTNEAHRPWVLAALAAGKHVLCEKPLGLDRREVDEMQAAAAAADRLLVEGFFYRWHPRMRRIDELVRSGALGEVRAVEAEFSFDGGGQDRMAGNFRLDPARGGGALYDVGVYPVSAAHTVLGAELAPAVVDLDIGSTGVDLDTQATLRAPCGATAEVRCAIDGRERQALAVSGETATVGTAEGEAFTSWHARSSLIVRTPDGVVREEGFEPVDPYRLMVEAVAARVRGEDAWLVPGGLSVSVATTLGLIRGLARRFTPR
jgi:predicted dehydrogenase